MKLSIRPPLSNPWPGYDNMALRFEDITEKNVDDLMSFCGNMPGIEKNPHFLEGRGGTAPVAAGNHREVRHRRDTGL